jgi:hypothetical protein
MAMPCAPPSRPALGPLLALHAPPTPPTPRSLAPPPPQVFSKTTIVDAHGERPYFLNPLIAAAQLINVARPGEEPAIWEAEEDCRWGLLCLAARAELAGPSPDVPARSSSRLKASAARARPAAHRRTRPTPPPAPSSRHPRLIHPDLADADGNPLPVEARRKWADNPANVEGLWYDTDLVYTIHAWQHVSLTGV